MPRRRDRVNRVDAPMSLAATPSPQGGAFRPLRDHARDAITASALNILSRIGMADCPAEIAQHAVAGGASLGADGRLRFPRPMVEAAIGRAARRVSLPGFVEDAGLEIGGGRVHVGTGGAAVEVLEADGETYRGATLRDLYALMRVVAAAPNVHYGVRPVVARDAQTPRALDVDTAFACLKACPKPIGVSFDTAAHVPQIRDLFDLSLGAADSFRKHPFCFAVVVHAVSPLRFAPEGLEIMRAAIAAGMPLQICTAAQAGATSPVTLAGALAQGLAEALAGLMIVDAIQPGFPCIFALMPFISDLRTGAMTGGGGESAVANAAAAQLLLDLALPSTVSAGMTDAKAADAQYGYEKGYTVALAAQAGADMINLSVGMLGSIMAASREALVIDDEMCGAVLRSVRGVELDAGGVDLELIEHVATGPGHYLGAAQTLERMKTEYVYPRLGDRRSIDDWRDAGRPQLWDQARLRVREILATAPTHLSKDREAAIRSAFDITLPEE